jgi:[ribosomal protein S5]-alanine N-acetyltransferase
MNFQINFRPFKLADAAFVNQLRRNEEMERLIGGLKRPVALERDVKWIEGLMLNDDQKIIYFAITLTGSDDIIGYTSISEIDYRNGTCFWSGIKVDPTLSGKGIGSEVALKVLKFVFEELRMVRCKGECLENHTGILNMLLKIGFKQEGLMRNAIFKNGTHNNTWLLSVIDTEYQEIKARYEL